MNGDPANFVQFSGAHFAALAVIAAAAIALTLALRRSAGRASAPALRLVVCWGLAALLVVAQLAEQGAAIVGGYWSLQQTLPLHLCDIAVVVVAVALVGAARVSSPLKNRSAGPPSPAQRQRRVGGVGLGGAGLGGPALLKTGTPTVFQRAVSASVSRRQQLLYELAWFWGIGGTVQALLTPDLNDPFPQPAYFAYFAEHGAIVVAVAVMTAGLGMRPSRGALWRVWLLTNALAIPMGVINAVLGSNYMFLCGPPENPSLYDYFGPWPWSLITLEVVGTATLALCYAPFWLSDRLRLRRSPTLGKGGAP